VPAYVVATLAIRDPDLYEQYKPLVGPSLEPFEGRLLARAADYDTLEGGDLAPELLVLLEFPTLEQARAWHSSPEYAEAKALRLRAADGTLLLLGDESEPLRG
jgi:uncharacterized protein (DUF1330 family)